MQTSHLVLVAEDNPVNQKLALAMLRQIGYQCEVVANGSEAVQALSTGSYSAILMDCQMPVMDGYQATRAIRVSEDQGARIPIIAMTAAAMEGEQERCLAAGMDDYLSKPVMLGELKAVLDRWIHGGPAKDASSDPGQRKDASSLPIDPSRIEELEALSGPGEKNGFEVLAEIFLEDAPRRLSDIRGHLSDGDHSEVKAGIHALRGSAASLGAATLAGYCNDIELMSTTGSLIEVEGLLGRVEREYARVEEALRSYLRGK